MYDPVAIMTKRLIIKEADSTDLDTLLNLWSNHQVMRFSRTSQPSIRGPGGIEVWWEKYKTRRTKAPWERQFVIQIKDGPFIGESGWTRLDDPNQVRGYNIEPRLITVMTDVKFEPFYWDLGYGSEVLNELLWWAFDTAGVDTILAPNHMSNDEARKMYEECGFTDTGLICWNNYRLFEFRKDEWVG